MLSHISSSKLKRIVLLRFAAVCNETDGLGFQTQETKMLEVDGAPAD